MKFTFKLLIATLLMTLALSSALALTEEGYTLVDENAALALYIRPDTGEVIVENKLDGYLWRSNPTEADDKAKGVHKMTLQSQIVITFTNDRGTALTCISQTDSVNKGGLTVTVQDKTAVSRYYFAKQNVAVTVEYRLLEGALEVSIPVDKIENDEINTVVYVELLPAFDAQGSDASGYLLLPDGSGALINYNNGVTAMSEYKTYVYGKDPSVTGQVGEQATLATIARTTEATTRLPVFGSGGRDHGFLAVITENEAKAVLHARVSNLTSYNIVYSEFQVLNAGSVTMNKKEFGTRVTGIRERAGLTTGAYTVRYYLLSGEEQSTYAAMAAVYRKYLQEEQGLTQRVQQGDYPLYLDVHGYAKKQAQFLGIPYTKAWTFTSIQDIREMVNTLGVAQSVVRYQNWVSGTSYEKIPQNANVQSGLGTAKELTALSSDLAKQGGALYPSMEMVNVYEGGNGFNALWDAVLSPINAPQMQYMLWYDSMAVNRLIKPWYLLSPAKFHQFFDKLMAQYKKLDVTNISFTGIGDICTADNRTDGFGRGNVPALTQDVIHDVQAVSPSVMLGKANAYAAVLADHILETPDNSSQYMICDETVPFYQMVFHGSVSYSLSTINHASTPYNQVLRCLEYGASPLFAFAGQNKEELIGSRLDFLISPDYTLWQEDVRAYYDLLRDVLAPVAAETITDHQILSDTLRKTTYQTRAVYINYGDEAVETPDGTVPACGYLVKEVSGQ